jgi:hypothetical protein
MTIYTENQKTTKTEARRIHTEKREQGARGRPAHLVPVSGNVFRKKIKDAAERVRKEQMLKERR